MTRPMPTHSETIFFLMEMTNKSADNIMLEAKSDR